MSVTKSGCLSLTSYICSSLTLYICLFSDLFWSLLRRVAINPYKRLPIYNMCISFVLRLILTLHVSVTKSGCPSLTSYICSSLTLYICLFQTYSGLFCVASPSTPTRGCPSITCVYLFILRLILTLHVSVTKSGCLSLTSYICSSLTLYICLFSDLFWSLLRRVAINPYKRLPIYNMCISICSQTYSDLTCVSH